ncbi:MAG: M50 family metallopeptidase [Legionellales bacterium]
MVVAIVAIMLTLILVVGVHEAGHALAARLFGVTIRQISIGFGRSLFRWPSKNGCDWVWALWPLGGSVSLLNSRIYPVVPSQYPYCFDKKPVWMRVCILLAGSFSNLVAAWLAFVLAFLLGISYSLPIIQEVQEDSVAGKAGVLAGSQFINVGGEPTPTWRDVSMQLLEHWGKKDLCVILQKPNSGESIPIQLDLSRLSFVGHTVNMLSSLGIVPNVHAPKALLRATSLVDAMHQANRAIVNLVYFFLIVLKQLITNLLPFSLLLGPLGLFAVTITSLSQGLAVFMYFIATLSLSVGIFNLLPVPILDGGSILYALVERLRGKPVSIAMEVLIHRLFFILLCVLLAHLFANDLLRLHA